MKRRTVRGDRSVSSYYHRETVMKVVERLFCPCGTLIYEGPKPNFSAVSCPKCKAVTEIRK